MAKVSFNAENKEVLDSLLLEIPEVEPGAAFGYPAYYVNGKMFACLYRDGVALKLPVGMADEISGREGIGPFEPMAGRRMKQWVLVTREDPDDYAGDMELLRAAFEYVYSLTRGG